MGLLDRIFRRKEKLIEAADIGRLKVDIHSHLIPGIDDGAQDIEQSMELLHRFADMGFRKVITTPHVMSDYYKNDSESILTGLNRLRGVIEAEKLDIEVEAAAEYYLDDMFEGLIETDDLLTFGPKKYVLFELPFVAEPMNLNRAIFNLQLKGYKPVLAHPERYGYWSRDLDKYKELHDKGVVLQLNSNSLSGYYGPEVKKVADHLVNQGLIDLVGTDCHRLEHLEVFEKVTLRLPIFHKLMDNVQLLNPDL